MDTREQDTLQAAKRARSSPSATSPSATRPRRCHNEPICDEPNKEDFEEPNKSAATEEPNKTSHLQPQMTRGNRRGSAWLQQRQRLAAAEAVLGYSRGRVSLRWAAAEAVLGYSVERMDSSCNLSLEEWMKAVTHLLCMVGMAGNSPSTVDSKQLQAIRDIYFAVVSTAQNTAAAYPPQEAGSRWQPDSPLFVCRDIRGGLHLGYKLI